MFEFLGIAVVCFIGWRVLKSFSTGAVQAHMNMSVGHAVSQGVPPAFARQMIVDRDAMSAARDYIAKQDPDVRLQDAYVQNGNAITLIYRGFQLSQKEKVNV